MHFYRGVIEQNRERCAYWAHAPKLPGLFAEAGTVAELTGGLGDALKGYLDGMFPDGVIPEGDLTLDDPIVSLEIEHNRERIWLCLNVARGSS
jgi:predicted RNase H-like HicB family nuclease